MRLRNIPRAAETVSASPLVIQDPSTFQGSWRRLFGTEGPLQIELGMGKGKFLRNMAEIHPDICYVGIERYTSVLLRAVEGVSEPLPLCNFRFVCEDAAHVAELFAPGEVDRIYLNFSDPWPKERHAERRLTSPRFLSLYAQVLAPGGTVEFKTDNQDLFSYSLETARREGWKITAETRDLHHDPMNEGNVMTEYEEKFASLGNPICKMILRPPDETSQA